jgi:cell division protein FtsI (penicillin-binding protein 3)
MGLFRRTRKPPPPCVPADLPGASPLVRLEGAQKAAIETGRTRLVIAGMLFTLSFVVLAGRLVQLTLLPAAEAPQARNASLAPPPERVVMDRQPIVDRNGVLLASNLRSASLFAEPRKILNADEAAARLVQVLPELSEADVRAKLNSGKSFAWLRRNLTPRQQYEVNRLGIPGLMFQAEQRRVYPQGSLAAHVVGFADVDGKGLAGIEQFFDETLRDPAREGEPLQLSIDVRVQHAMRDELLRAMTEFNAIGAGGIVLDIHTGEIVAMVSLPDFDPAQPGEGPKDARFNRMTLGVYEMGSTMKTLNTAMALDSGLVKLSGGFDASRPIQIGKFTIRDDHPKNRWLSVPEIFMYSSNIGSAKMALEIGPAGQRAFMDKLGMLKKPVIELPEIGGPLVPRNWKTVETMTIAFGHGLSITPLQLATATAAIVNGGVLHPATLVKRPPGLPVPGQQVISRQVSDTMRKLLHLVVEDGTGKKATVDGYLVGGKTGTSEKVNDRGGYNRKALFNTFIAAFPMNAPRYIVMGTVDEPKGNKSTYGFSTAGWTTAPAVGRIIARIAPMLGVEPVDENSNTVRQAMFVPIPGQMEFKPDKPEKKLAAY